MWWKYYIDDVGDKGGDEHIVQSNVFVVKDIFEASALTEFGYDTNRGECGTDETAQIVVSDFPHLGNMGKSGWYKSMERINMPNQNARIRVARHWLDGNTSHGPNSALAL